jgi:hypothetical protein
MSRHHSPKLIVGSLLLTVLLGLGAYLVVVPAEDRRSLQYTLWKHDLFPNRAAFVPAFLGDTSRDNMVLGKSETYLRSKFTPMGEGKKNQQYWNEIYDRYLSTDRFLWLWDGPCLVVIRDDRAIYFNYQNGPHPATYAAQEERWARERAEVEEAAANWNGLRHDLTSAYPWLAWRHLGRRVWFQSYLGAIDRNPILLDESPISVHVRVSERSMADFRRMKGHADSISLEVDGQVASINPFTKHVSIERGDAVVMGSE